MTLPFLLGPGGRPTALEATTHITHITHIRVVQCGPVELFPSLGQGVGLGPPPLAWPLALPGHSPCLLPLPATTSYCCRHRAIATPCSPYLGHAAVGLSQRLWLFVLVEDSLSMKALASLPPLTRACVPTRVRRCATPWARSRHAARRCGWTAAAWPSAAWRRACGLPRPCRRVCGRACMCVWAGCCTEFMQAVVHLAYHPNQSTSRQ